MKINSITNSNQYHSRGKLHSAIERREHATLSNLNENNQINTTIKRNSDGRASFKGGVPVQQTAEKIKKPLLHSIAGFTNRNPLVAEAIFAIFITCGIRPLTIMATAKNDKDKSKCEYQAMKSISSGIIGLGMTALVGTPISKATKAAKDNGALEIPAPVKEKLTGVVDKGVEALHSVKNKLTESKTAITFADDIQAYLEGSGLNKTYLKERTKKQTKDFLTKLKEVAPESVDDVSKAFKAQTRMSNYSGAGKNVIDKLFQPAFMPLRAAVTIALVPVFLKLLGKQKPTNKPQEAPINNNIQIHGLKDEKAKEVFGSFAGVLNNENK